MWFQGGAVAPSSTCRRRRRCKGPGETASLRRSRLETQSETRWCDVGSKISSIPLAARAPRNNSEHTLLGASHFLSSIFFTHTPLQVTRTGTRIIGRIATPQPRAWRVLEVREGRVGIGRAPWAGRSLARQRQRAQETRSTEMELGRRDVGLFSFCTSRRNMHNSQHPLADRRFRGAHERAETAPKTNAA